MRALVIAGKNLFAGTNGGVYRSTNNGKSWALSSAGLPDRVVKAVAEEMTRPRR